MEEKFAEWILAMRDPKHVLEQHIIDTLGGSKSQKGKYQGVLDNKIEAVNKSRGKLRNDLKLLKLCA